MAQSPVLLFGGAAATVLKGRGSLQDIDQIAFLSPIVKWATSVRTVSALGPTVEKAIEIAKGGVPGPVFIEVPVDLLYHEDLVREWYLSEAGVKDPKGLPAKALNAYLRAHLYRQFHQPHLGLDLPDLPELRLPGRAPQGRIAEVVELLRNAERPAIVVGSQTLVNRGPDEAEAVADALRALGAPTWLGGMARGLLGRHCDIQFRHKRSKALRKADVVIVCGFPFDFRLGYGRSIGSKATVVSANLSASDLKKNRRPEVALQMHPGDFLIALAEAFGGPEAGPWDAWFDQVRENERARDAEIAEIATLPTPKNLVNPVDFFLQLEEAMADDAVLVVDGGDFVATGAYTLRPRKPLRWLDPGVFGTLGVGGGFTTGAAAVHPGTEIWLIYGDGSSAYSLAEFDTYVRHGFAPIAVIGTDA
ncbi:MAG: thiamine pyrophosphate-binding protein, partial [Myxococcales bacterium]|nr:thiamine pyrophosphate-binding protein [Myxococcales bacterium]